jgi:hypothetical protein
MEAYRAAFQRILAIVHQQGLISAYAAGVDSTTIEANASLKRLARKDSGASYLDYVKELMRDAGEEPVDAAGYNLSLVMRHLHRHGTPREMADQLARLFETAGSPLLLPIARFLARDKVPARGCFFLGPVEFVRFGLPYRDTC